jgi:superfamily I DNA/RNA helicase
MFARPFALWRVFLHPAQRRTAHAAYRGPARIMGGPGTGKTVAALHRALHLARQSSTPHSILLTTFSRTLSAALERDLRVLFDDDDDLLTRVDVRGLDQLAHQIVTAEHGRPVLLTPAEEREWWATAVAEQAPESTPAFLAEEWRTVVLARDIPDALGYVRTPRPGRGRPLSAAQRGPIWAAMRVFTERLRRERRWTHETVCVEAARILAAQMERPYRHAIVDEAQDLAPWQWRLIRAAVAPGSDDLFIAGDAHQRIYGHRVSLRQLGIDVVGRSERLRINYRTTAEILTWSMGLLPGEAVEGIDADAEALTGCRSEVHGPAPILIATADRDGEASRLIATVRAWLAEGVRPGQIGVAARTTALARAAVTALGSAGIEATVLGEGTRGSAGVVVATMHRMKGLEFRCVAVIGVDARTVPLAAAVAADTEDPIAHEWDIQRERCLLFVACTRAREQLVVSWSGAPSPFLDAVR